MRAFALPLGLPTFTLSLLWHPRMDGDLAHRWLRGHIRSVCTQKRRPD
jgi:DNA-binding transcriptional LysR family regulator